MKITIFGITISTPKRIKGIIIKKDITCPKTYGYLLGVYDSRIFGFCFHRNKF